MQIELALTLERLETPSMPSSKYITRIALAALAMALLCIPATAPNLVHQTNVHLSSVHTLSQEDPLQIYHSGDVETVRVVEYDNLALALDALDSGEADIFGHVIDPEDYAAVDSYSNIQKQWAHDTNTYMLVLNAEVYPLDNSHLRRAIAFAIDKNEIVTSAMGGIVDAIDFALPLNNEFSIELTEGGTFYASDNVSAAAELALAGMLDVDEDGMVEAPNGNEMQLTVWYPLDVPGLNETALIITDNLLASGINSTLVGMNYTDLQNEIVNHNQTFSLALYHQDLPLYGLDWAAMTFHSDNLAIIGENPANIQDTILDQVAAYFEDNIYIDEAPVIGLDALRIVRDLCPVIPLFAERWLSIYTDSNYQGWIDERNGGAYSVWNPVTLTPNSAEVDELVVAVLPEFFGDYFTSLNPFLSGRPIDSDWLFKSQFNPYMLIYDSPIATTPDGNAVPRASTSWTMYYRGIVTDLRSNQTRARFYCDPNANWSDGTQLDAQDYRFTFEYYSNNSLTNFTGIVEEFRVTGDFIVGITMNSRFMFSYRELGALPILPQHIWNDKDPRAWDPTIEEFLGSGPFVVSSFVQGANPELVLTKNPGYYPVVDVEPPTLLSLVMIPENPIPAESVVIRTHVDDRSKIDNVNLTYIYEVGTINITDSVMMTESASGYEGTIPARVTASRIIYEIVATDVWGNSAVIATGSYIRETTSGGETWLGDAMMVMGIIGAGALVVVAIVFLRKRKQS